MWQPWENIFIEPKGNCVIHASVPYPTRWILLSLLVEWKQISFSLILSISRVPIDRIRAQIGITNIPLTMHKSK